MVGISDGIDVIPGRAGVTELVRNIDRKCIMYLSTCGIWYGELSVPLLTVCVFCTLWYYVIRFWEVSVPTQVLAMCQKGPVSIWTSIVI